MKVDLSVTEISLFLPISIATTKEKSCQTEERILSGATILKFEDTYCKICKMSMGNVTNILHHFRGSKHNKNVFKNELFQKHLDFNDKDFCQICDTEKPFANEITAFQHYQSRKHAEMMLKKSKKDLVKTEPPQDASKPSKIVQSNDEPSKDVSKTTEIVQSNDSKSHSNGGNGPPGFKNGPPGFENGPPIIPNPNQIHELPALNGPPIYGPVIIGPLPFISGQSGLLGPHPGFFGPQGIIGVAPGPIVPLRFNGSSYYGLD